MWSILADLVVGIFDFVLDVLLFRGLRRKHGQRNRSMTEDSFEVARFDFVTLTFIALVSVGLMLILALGFDVPAGWSVGIGITVGAIWGLWRYAQLVRE
ncbi:hypothetical protein J2W25_004879 [Variovorax boronicumulans]|uniref:Uncharacterized protein n=1 Tax=Variovorax boronicumulans TaxID=436515 RepID=A0AAW8E3Q5_9BURK|nr:hypothetical protein [Variovorax boronicumulans]MDP9880545.1 hypothetical protein [Variovorax boronicumulans]MDP9925832.1 hypothetical protein [Variovorax boronicumulans]